MLASPVDTPEGWTWEQLAHTFPEGRGVVAGTVFALRGRGDAKRLRSPITGSVAHASTGDVHVFVGSPADVLRQTVEVREALRFGNVQVIVQFTAAGVVDTVFREVGLLRGAAIGTIDITEVTIALRFAMHPAIDSLAVLRFLAAVLPEAPADDLRAWAAAFGTGEPALRIVGPSGRPFEAPLPLTLGTRDFELAAGDSDLLAASGLARRDLAAGTTLRWRGTGALQLATPAGATGVDSIAVDADTAYVTATRIDDWFAAQQAAGFARTTRGNRVTPLVNGPELFDALFAELHAIASSTPALYLTGYAIVHDAVLGPEEHPNRTLADLVRSIEAAGGESRFLALDFLQLDPTTVLHYEVAAIVLVVLVSMVGMTIAMTHDADAFDRLNAFGAATAIAGMGLLLSTMLDDIIEGREPNAAAVAALTTGSSVAVFDPYPAQLADNWRADTGAPPLSLVADVIRHFGVFHQKIAIVRNDADIHAYCGGIDLNPDRLDTREHGSRTPYHDVHARIDGPAVAELAQTFIQRWQREHADTPLSLAAPGTFDALPADGGDIVQVARTYYRPNRSGGGGAPLPFAPDGESTILETTLSAIAQARRYIYIEDQYLTPPPRYTEALAAAAARDVGALIIVVPDHPDQPFGLGPRQQFAIAMRDAWGDRLRIGTMRNPYSRFNASRTASLGRLVLSEELTPTAATVTVEPASRVPSPPFWLAIGREVMWVTGKSSPRDSAGHWHLGQAVTLDIERGGRPNLYGIGVGTDPARHAVNAAATVIQYRGIYVHSKVTLIDDCFASIGSANINRRGFFSDGECTVFATREQLVHGDNWIRTLRKRLWGELLGVPEAFALAMFDDPLANLDLFDRRLFTGNRFVPFDAHPFGADFAGLVGPMSASFTSESDPLDLVVSFLTTVAALTMGSELDARKIFDTVIDPTSHLEPRS